MQSSVTIKQSLNINLSNCKRQGFTKRLKACSWVFPRLQKHINNYLVQHAKTKKNQQNVNTHYKGNDKVFDKIQEYGKEIKQSRAYYSKGK